MMEQKGKGKKMARLQDYNIQVKRNNARHYTVSIKPSPVMKWHDVINAREYLKNIIRDSAGDVDRTTTILHGAREALRKWSNDGHLFPTHWNDGDEYIPLEPVASIVER